MKTRAYLGVLVGRRTEKNRPYHEQTTFFRRLIRAGRDIGVKVFVFSPPGINWRKRTIVGWTWTDQRWVRHQYPFPHAIFDRVSPKQKYDLSAVTRVRQRFHRIGMPLFNTKIGDKWALHRRFVKDPMLKDALPPTKILNLSNLKQMMDAYGEVYTKPANGGQGKGVGWAKRVPGGYQYRINGRRGSRSGRVTTLSALKSRCRTTGRIMLVQMAIPILKYEGRAFDVRTLVQRGGDGNWRVTGMVARLGAVGKKVTNIHAGGRAQSLESVLQACGADEETIQAVVDQGTRLALRVAENIAKTTRLVVELGIDLAIDRNYKVWFLEANSRTGRISFHRAGLTESARLADVAPAEYALFLAQGPPANQDVTSDADEHTLLVKG